MSLSSYFSIAAKETTSVIPSTGAHLPQAPLCTSILFFWIHRCIRNHISPLKPGVMKPQDIAPIDLPTLQKLYDASHRHITNMTIASELPGIEAVAAFAKEHHILLQAGHTNATYEEFLHGAKLGITHATHLFNAMSAFNHRDPGAAGAVLLHPEFSAEIIADGVHVHPDVVGFLRRVKPVQNIVLVTDALLPTGQEKGPFIANGEEVIFDGVWKRKADRVIAGSALTMLQGIKPRSRDGTGICRCGVPERSGKPRPDAAW